MVVGFITTYASNAHHY